MGVNGCGGARRRLPCHRLAVAAPCPGSVVDGHWRGPARDRLARRLRTPPRRPPDARVGCCRRSPRRRRVDGLGALGRHAAARPAAGVTRASSGARPCATRRRDPRSPPNVGRIGWGSLGRRAARVGAWRGRRAARGDRVGGTLAAVVVTGRGRAPARHDAPARQRTGSHGGSCTIKYPHHFDECVFSNVRPCFFPHEAGRPPATAAEAAEIRTIMLGSRAGTVGAEQPHCRQSGRQRAPHGLAHGTLGGCRGGRL